MKFSIVKSGAAASSRSPRSDCVRGRPAQGAALFVVGRRRAPRGDAQGCACSRQKNPGVKIRPSTRAFRAIRSGCRRRSRAAMSPT